MCMLWSWKHAKLFLPLVAILGEVNFTLTSFHMTISSSLQGKKLLLFFSISMNHLRPETTSCWKRSAFFIDAERGEGEEEECWKLIWKHELAVGVCGEVRRPLGDSGWLGWRGGLEVGKQVKHGRKFYFNRLTIFGTLDPGALVLPNDGGGRRTDDVTHNVGIITLVELLRTGRITEADLLCREI